VKYAKSKSLVVAQLLMLSCFAINAAHAQDAKSPSPDSTAHGAEIRNPLLPPNLRTPPPESKSATPTPALPSGMPAPSNAANPSSPEAQAAARISAAARHLSMVKVIATIGEKAVLRGPLGANGNLAIAAGSTGGLQQQGINGNFNQYQGMQPNQVMNGGYGGVYGGQMNQGLYGQPQYGYQQGMYPQGGGMYPGAGGYTGAGAGASGASAAASRANAIERSVTVTHGQPFELGNGMWVRPEVGDSSVRLYLLKTAKEKGGDLIYSSNLEMANAMAVDVPEKTVDKTQDVKADISEKPTDSNKNASTDKRFTFGLETSSTGQ